MKRVGGNGDARTGETIDFSWLAFRRTAWAKPFWRNRCRVGLFGGACRTAGARYHPNLTTATS
jgi:hypothetical protein